jgi:hypothetical protein
VPFFGLPTLKESPSQADRKHDGNETEDRPADFFFGLCLSGHFPSLTEKMRSSGPCFAPCRKESSIRMAVRQPNGDRSTSRRIRNLGSLTIGEYGLRKEVA